MTVYLIGGPPKCGKTTLAKKLSQELSVPWISADTLQNIAWTYIDKEKHKKYFPHKYARGKDPDIFYANNSPQEIIELYIAQGKTAYPAISMLVETYLIDKDDFIVEGYQVTPDIVSDILERFGTHDIKACFLTKHDSPKFVEDIQKSTTPNDWILRKIEKQETHQLIAEMVSRYSDYFKTEAKKYTLPVFNLDENFEDKILEAITFLKK